MTKSVLLGAAALLPATAATVMAKEVIHSPGRCAQFYPNANCQNKKAGVLFIGNAHPFDHPPVSVSR